MGTTTSLSILGIDAVDGNVHGTSTDAARVNAVNNRLADEPVPRVANEFIDQAEPHSMLGDPTLDNATGGTTDATRIEDTDAAYDGYGGRGAGKKFTDGSWDSSR